MITQRYDDLVSSVLLDSDKSRETPERIENLALELMKVFPKEKKVGTCHYFRGNRKDNTLKLKKFFKREFVHKDTGEIIESGKLLGMLDEEKIEELTARIAALENPTPPDNSGEGTE